MDGSRYRDPVVLRERLCRVLDFYYPDCVDDRFGGYVAQLDERDGHVYDGATKHLVATCRAIHNFALGLRHDGPSWCRQAAEHGLHFLRHVHWDDEHGGYDWLLEGRETVDATRHCYGHAFAVLAAATAVEAGLPDARAELDRAVEVLDRHFREPEHGLYADRADPDWEAVAPYRGQNANMHACEAHIAAYDATGEEGFLDRATTIAERLVRDRTDPDEPRLWEHYTADWEPDYDHNRDEPTHQFRPWGYQPGHHAEWAKLLCRLDARRDADWLLPRARALFDAAVGIGWDDEHGGLFYTVEADGTPVDDDTYGWAVAEAIGAAALLAAREDGSRYGDWYDRLWAYADDHLVNPRFGNWYERLPRDHERDGPNHGVAVEPGYHPIANLDAAIGAFGDGPA